MEGQLSFLVDSTQETVKRLPWGYQIGESQVMRKKVIAVPDGTKGKLTCCPCCGAVFGYRGQKFCGGCGSELKIMSEEKYAEFCKQHRGCENA